MPGSIPIIDFASCGLLVENDCDVDEVKIAEVGKEMYEAFSTAGFVYITNSGIERRKVDEVNDVAEKFYKLPLEVKNKYCTGGMVYGYDPIGATKANPKRYADYHEGFRMSGEALENNATIWPDDPEFKEKYVEFSHLCKILTKRIFKALGTGMKLKDPNYFCKCHERLNQKGNFGSLKTIYYPPISDETTLHENQIRIGEHTDIGSLTLLFQDKVGGLQVQDSEGEFIDVRPIPDTVILNIADCMEHWAEGRLKSTIHRVVPPTDPPKRNISRRTLIYFAVPDNEVLLEKLEFQDSIERSDHPEKKQQPMTSFQYSQKRFSEHFYVKDKNHST